MPTQAYTPHRGVLILVFGILELCVCIIFGICAWVMGNSDLREMDAGRMDPEGRGLTTAGKVCGIVAVCLTAFGLCIAVAWMVLAMVMVAGAGAGAAAGAGGP